MSGRPDDTAPEVSAEIESTASGASAMRRALKEIRSLKQRLAVAERGGASTDPVAIVGVGVRLPGGIDSFETFGRFLDEGGDAIGALPTDRWDHDRLFDPEGGRSGTYYIDRGGFLPHVDQFDPEFFGIAPLEATTMDPQQRLLLECVWEGLEHAGIAARSLAGADAGVFVGIGTEDYSRMTLGSLDGIDAYSVTGTTHSVASGRISYLLGLRGPAISVDTACSSSLVALHLACQSLRGHECSIALAGGVGLILGPELHVNFCEAGMLARDGRCKAFDSRADGYVRSEGCGIAVLKRLDDAVADGDRVLAVIRGSALNQDGRSSGLTAPSGPAQEAVIRAALRNAGVSPDEIGYVEGHGTGTELGDPIEVGALGAVFGQRDRANALLLGSVKSNLGHLESAAGIAGVLKAAWALGTGVVPRQLHFEQPNPHIPWSELPIRVVDGPAEIPRLGEKRLVGVSSFGFSGTNAHLILEEAPAPAEALDENAPSSRGWALEVVPLSAPTESGLEALVDRWTGYLAVTHEPWPSVCHTAALGRTEFEYRLAVTGASAAEARERLLSWRSGEEVPGVRSGRVLPAMRPPLGFLFTGQGAQYPGMGWGLLDASPAFRSVIERCDEALVDELDIPLIELLDPKGPDAQRIHETRLTHPALYAIQCGLVEFWSEIGVEPDVILGHSLGEYAAAYRAGVFSLEDGARMVSARGRVLSSLAVEGRMMAVRLDEAKILPWMEKIGDEIGIAAINSSEQVVVSGTPKAVATIEEWAVADGVETHRLTLRHPFHTPLIADAADRFRSEIGAVSLRPGSRSRLISTVTGRVVDPEELADPEYWIQQIVQPVRFTEALASARDESVEVFLEIGPAGTLTGLGSLEDPSGAASWIASLDPELSAADAVTTAMGSLFTENRSPDWVRRGRLRGNRKATVPGHPFERRRFWLDGLPSSGSAVAQGRRSDKKPRSWTSVRDRALRLSEWVPADLELARYPEKWDALAELSLAVGREALGKLEALPAGSGRTVDEIVAETGIDPMYRRIVGRWLDGLMATGVIEGQEDRYSAAQGLTTGDPAAAWARAESAMSDDPALWAYIRHAGSLAGEVLSGRASPLDTLFPGGSFELADRLYVESQPLRYVNGIAAEVVRTRAEQISNGTIRVLEVGAGTGGTTRAVLPVLPEDRTRYDFTDVTPFFVDRARNEFGEFTGIEAKIFNMDEDAASQGFEERTYDMVIGANVLHAARDLPRALERVRSLLKPGGLLILVESTGHLAWHDITTGLIEGWQHFEDDLRSESPLLTGRTWIGALEAAGFEEAVAAPPDDAPAGVLRQALLVAVAPDAPVPGVTMESTAVSRSPAAASAPPAGAAESFSSGSPAVSMSVEDDATGLALEETFAEQIADAVGTERLALVTRGVRVCVMEVLGSDPSRPPSRDARLMQLGLDSLMAVKLRNLLQDRLNIGTALPVTLAFDYPTIGHIAELVLERITSEPSVTDGELTRDSAPMAGTANRESELEALTEEEVEALLLQKLDSEDGL